jgi:hypothetical protein
VADDEVERLRAALTHAHDIKTSRLRSWIRRLAEPMRERIQKREIEKRITAAPEKKDAA